jgi:hypothetical protein
VPNTVVATGFAAGTRPPPQLYVPPSGHGRGRLGLAEHLPVVSVAGQDPSHRAAEPRVPLGRGGLALRKGKAEEKNNEWTKKLGLDT